MSRKIIQIRQQNRILQLTWIINNICTNHCDYCPTDLHTGTNHHYDWEKAKSFSKRLIDYYPKIKLSVSGGEPTVSPFFTELVDMFYSAGHIVNVTSNGSRSVRYWSEIAPKLENICFSYHPSYANPDFLEKVCEAAKHTVVTVRVMMDSRYWDQARQFFDESIKHRTFDTEAVRILPEMAFNNIGSEYSAEQLEWLKSVPRNSLTEPIFKNNPNHRRIPNALEIYYDNGEYDLGADPNGLILTNQNSFTGWCCNIGLESLFIHYNGLVKKANCFQGGHLFHINNHEEHELPTNAEICYQDVCFCPTDILISKVPMYDRNDDILKNKIVVRFNQEK